MKFQLVDKILSLKPGEWIVTIKNLTLAEEYLGDHFPGFPVLPGVLMLEMMTQSAAWLVRLQQQWKKSIVVLQTAKNVRYGHFVQPGATLRCDIQAIQIGDEISKFKATLHVSDAENPDGVKAVSGRLELRSYNVLDKVPHMAGADEEIIEQLKSQFAVLGGPALLEKTATSA